MREFLLAHLEGFMFFGTILFFVSYYLVTRG
jgi:hypothetical protein